MSKKKLEDCHQRSLAARDALEIINAKWRIPIIIAIGFGFSRFNELERQITGVSAKMLAKELKFLEENHIVQRKVTDKDHVLVEYTLTEFGRSLDRLLEELHDWGVLLRKKVIRKAEKVKV